MTSDEVLTISKRCYRVIMFNFWGTITVDTIGIVLAFFGQLSPSIVALIHVGSELPFIFNSAHYCHWHSCRPQGVLRRTQLVSLAPSAYRSRMVIVRFEDAEIEKLAVGWLAGRFSFKTWSNGDLMLHERVLPYLARQGIPFKVQGH